MNRCLYNYFWNGSQCGNSIDLKLIIILYSKFYLKKKASKQSYGVTCSNDYECTSNLGLICATVCT